MECQKWISVWAWAAVAASPSAASAAMMGLRIMEAILLWGFVTGPPLSFCAATAHKRDHVTASPARKSRHHENLVAGGEGRGDGGHLVPVHEDLDVRPDRVLLVDHAEADAGIASIEVREQLVDGSALRLDLAPVGGVRGERARQDHPHASSAASTECTCGRCRHRQCQLAPSSKLAQTSPLVVPK